MFDYHFPDKMNTKSVFVFETVSGKSIWIKFMVILQREQKESNIDERLASARKRLHENYQEAQNGFYFWKFPVEKYFVKRVHHMVYWRGVTDTIHARPRVLAMGLCGQTWMNWRHHVGTGMVLCGGA